MVPYKFGTKVQLGEYFLIGVNLDVIKRVEVCVIKGRSGQKIVGEKSQKKSSCVYKISSWFWLREEKRVDEKNEKSWSCELLDVKENCCVVGKIVRNENESRET